MPTRGTATTPFRIPPDLKRQAKEEAGRRGETLTDVVIRALREYIAAPVTPHTPK